MWNEIHPTVKSLIQAVLAMWLCFIFFLVAEFTRGVALHLLLQIHRVVTLIFIPLLIYLLFSLSAINNKALGRIALITTTWLSVEYLVFNSDSANTIGQDWHYFYYLSLLFIALFVASIDWKKARTGQIFEPESETQSTSGH